MRRRSLCAAVCIALAACGDHGGKPGPGDPDAKVAAESACRALRFENTPFSVCTARRDRHTLRFVLDAPDGEPLRRLDSLGSVLGADLARVAFAANGGMFDDSGEPVGLYRDATGEHRRLNRNPGPGNFHLMPNGVFYADMAGWHVTTSDGFADAKPEALAATQSGPMLVMGGALHPRFHTDGPSRLIRNGVGVTASGDAVFAIADGPVSFGRFARLFRDTLGCPNALFLDGSVSQLWDPASGRLDAGPPLGPMIVAIERPARSR